MKKPSKKTQTNKCDKLFRDIIRSYGFCQAEGKDKIKCGGVLQCCHIVTRSNRRLRWDQMNAVCMCAGHHRYYTNRPFEWIEFISGYYPEKFLYIKKHREELWDKQYPVERLKKELEEIKEITQ